jgi:hypothetical protein
MPGQSPALTTLQSRKRLLLAEAATQREQLHCDLGIIKSGLHRVGEQTRSVGSIASVVVFAIAGFSAIQALRGVRRAGQPSWLSRMLAGARVASTVWLALAARKR